MTIGIQFIKEALAAYIDAADILNFLLLHVQLDKESKKLIANHLVFCTRRVIVNKSQLQMAENDCPGCTWWDRHHPSETKQKLDHKAQIEKRKAALKTLIDGLNPKEQELFKELSAKVKWEVETILWDDIVGCEKAKDALIEAIVNPIKFSEETNIYKLAICI